MTATTGGAAANREAAFFLRSAIAMAVIVAAGFSFQLAMGRSTFASPPLVHAHAIVFMGWVVLFLLQTAFVATGRLDLHRLLGWVSTAWIAAMIVLGCLVTAAMVRRGQVPFFFRPLQFLVFDPLTLFVFAGLTAAAITLRRRTDWHRRLHISAMALLLAPAISRLLPGPPLAPWAWETTMGVCAAVLAAVALFDTHRSGRFHPAWRWGFAAMAACLLLTEAITYSPVGAALYAAVTRGSPGAQVAPLAFPSPPARPQPSAAR